MPGPFFWRPTNRGTSTKWWFIFREFPPTCPNHSVGEGVSCLSSTVLFKTMVKIINCISPHELAFMNLLWKFDYRPFRLQFHQKEKLYQFWLENDLFYNMYWVGHAPFWPVRVPKWALFLALFPSDDTKLVLKTGLGHPKDFRCAIYILVKFPNKTRPIYLQLFPLFPFEKKTP